MQTITDDLRAILKAKFQASADGFRGRLEMDSPGVPAGIVQWGSSGGGALNVLTLPDPPVAGDILLMCRVSRCSDGGEPGPSAGWTALGTYVHIRAGDVAGPDNAVLWYKESDGTEQVTTWNGHVYAAIWELAGADMASAEVISATYTTSDPMPIGTFSALGPQDLVLAGWVVDQGDGDVITGTPGTGLVIDLQGAQSPGNGHPHHIFAHSTTSITPSVSGMGSREFAGIAVRIPPATPAGFAAMSPSAVKRISIDKSLQTDSDAFEVELDNSDGSKSLYPAGDTYLPTKKIRIFQWYGDPANAVQTFDGFIDKPAEHRPPATLTLTGRDWMKRLLVQDILVTAPQGADEDGAVRTTANFVYLNMEVSDIVVDLLDKANYPTGAARSVQQTSYMVAEFLGSDGNSFADALGQLADLVGYNSSADELGVYHFEPNARAQSTDTDTADVPVWTFRAGEDIYVIDPEQDDYDLKTRIRVTGPMSTTVLNDAFTELWHSAAVKKPTGVWFDATDAGNVRVADGATRKLYKVSQTTRAIVSSTAALCSHFLGDVTGDPSDASKYWILELPWKNGLPGTASTVYQLDKTTNAVLASFALPSGRWTGMDVDATHVWLANWDTNQIHCYTRAGASVASYTLSDGGVAQVDPTGVIVDGTTLYVFFYNTNRILVSTTATPATITKTISTAGTQMLGGEVDSVTHTEFWACSDSLGLTWKYTLAVPVTTERAVYVEVTNDAVGVNSSPGLSAFETALGEVRRKVIRMDAITSLAQATETAQRWLSQLDHTRQTLDFGIIGNPAIQKGDMVRVEDPVSGIVSDWGVDTYRSDMSGEAGTYLGVISALPWDPRYSLPTTAAEVAAWVEEGVPGGGAAPNVARLTSADSEATFLSKTLDMTIDVIELAAGDYDWQDVHIDVDRTSRPLAIQTAVGAEVNFVGPATTTGSIFYLGNSTMTKWVTFDGSLGAMVFKDFALAQSGVIEPRGTDHCTFKGLTFQNLSRDGAYATHPYQSWCFYISGAGSGGNDHLLIDQCRFAAPAVARDISAIQVASSGSHGAITITNVLEMTNYDYGFYAEQPTSALTLNNWTMDNTGNSPTPASIRFTAAAISGSYSNITATSSDPLLDDSTGTMVDGGGNTGL